MFYLGKASRANLKGVHPQLVFILEQALADSPIDFGIPKNGGVRTTITQLTLFEKGLSGCDGVKKISKHQLAKGLGPAYGLAVDIFAYVNGKSSYELPHIYAAASAIMTTAARLKKDGRVSIVLRWGATFGSEELLGWDSGHIEIVSIDDE